MTQPLPSHKHAERLRRAFQSVHLLSICQEPRGMPAFRARVTRDLRDLRLYVNAGVACQLDLDDVIAEVPNSFLRAFSHLWLDDVQGRPNPLRSLFELYVAAGYLPLNQPMPDSGLAPAMRCITHFDYAVRCAKDPRIVALLLSLGADENLVSSGWCADGRPPVARRGFLDYVHYCAVQRANFGAPAEKAETTAQLFRAAALEGLMQRLIAREGPAPSLPLLRSAQCSAAIRRRPLL